jgi:hypothetical protein
MGGKYSLVKAGWPDGFVRIRVPDSEDGTGSGDDDKPLLYFLPFLKIGPGPIRTILCMNT